MHSSTLQRMRGTTTIAVAAVLSLASCRMAVPANLTDPRSGSRPAFEGWFPRAQRAVISQGLSIAYENAEAGLIATEWVTYRTSVDTRRDRFLIRLVEDKIVVTCQCQYGTAGVQGDCDLQEEARSLLAEAIAATM